MVDKPPPLMSAAEEAALLAEYGTVGPYDDLLALPAASKCVFDYGGRDVFLTGGDTDADACENTTPAPGPVTDNMNPDWPLECALLRHTNLISVATPESMWESVAEMLRTTSNTDPKSSAENKEDRSDVELINQMDELLREADSVMARHGPNSRWVDPINDEWILAQRREIEEEEALWLSSDMDATSNPSQDENEGKNKDDLEIEREESILVNGNIETELNSLFAFEFGPTKEEEDLKYEWEKLVVRAEEWHMDPMVTTIVAAFDNEEMVQSTPPVEHLKSNWVTNSTASVSVLQHATPVKSTNGSDPSNDKSIPSSTGMSLLRAAAYVATPLSNAEVLESIRLIDKRDEAAAALAAQRLRDRRAEWRSDRLEQRGMLVLDSFVTRIDALLPPVVLSPGTEEAMSTSAITQRAKREMFLVRQEVEEARRMLLEDEVATQKHLIQEAEAQATAAAAEQEAKMKTEIKAAADVDETLSRERIARLGVLSAEWSQRRNLFMVAFFDAEQGFRRGIESEASKALECVTVATKHIATSAERRKHCVAVAVGMAQNALVARHKKHLDEAYRNTESTMNERRVHTLKPLKKTEVKYIAWPALARIDALSHEFHMESEWRKDCRQRIADAADALAEPSGPPRTNERNSTSSTTPLVNTHPTSAFTNHGGESSRNGSANTTTNTTMSTSAPLKDGVCLNAALMRKLLLLSAHTNPREAAVRCRIASFALERISSIDFANLAAFQLRSGVPAVSFIQEIDLGGNCLAHLPLDELLRTFSGLEDVRLCDNQLRTITSGAANAPRGVAAAQAHAISRSTRVERVDFSVNGIENLEAVGKLLAYSLRTLVMYANHIDSLLPLAPCTRLEVLEANRNRISSLTEIQQLHLLRTLDLNDNNIHDLTPVMRHVLLEALYLSRNRITTLPSTGFAMPFLQQLFINENALQTLPAESFQWLPLLSVFHANGNHLKNIAGLAHCPRLTDVSLAFNKICCVEDLAPLAACRALCTLNLSENPLAQVEAWDATQQWLLSSFPHLRELNHTAVSESMLRAAVKKMAEVSLAPFCTARHVRRLQNTSLYAEGTYFFWDNSHWVNEGQAWRMCVEAMEQECVLLQLRSRYSSADETHAALHKVFANDSFLVALQSHDPRYYQGKNWKKEEATLPRRRQLAQLRSGPIGANAHGHHALYEALASAHREEQAAMVLGRLAWRCIAARRKRTRRLEAAARVIQPVWRGAALRSRLRRIMRPNGEVDEDDENEFVPVEVDFTEPMAVPGGGIGEVLQAVLRSRGAQPRFSPRQAQPAPSQVSPLPQTPQRPHSDGGPHREPQQRLSARPPSQPLHTSTPKMDEWGPMVAAQLRRRQEKRDRAGKEQQRRDFLQDPLRSKRNKKG